MKQALPLSAGLTIVALLALGTFPGCPGKSPAPAPSTTQPPATATQAPPASSTVSPAPITSTPEPPETIVVPPVKTTSPAPPPATPVQPPPTPAPAACADPIVKTLVKANPLFPGSTDHYECSACGKPVACPVAPAPVPPAAPSTITLTQGYLNSRMLLPSNFDGRPAVDQLGRKCHGPTGPLPCSWNGGDVLHVVALPSGGFGVFVHSWVKSGGIPGVHTICGICGGPTSTADACGIGWLCDPKGTVWPVAVNETPTKKFTPEQAAAVATFRATKVPGGLTLADFLPKQEQ